MLTSSRDAYDTTERLLVKTSEENVLLSVFGILPSGACSPKQVFLALTLTQGLCVFTLRYVLRVAEHIRAYFQDTCKKVGIVSITSVSEQELDAEVAGEAGKATEGMVEGWGMASYKQSYY